ncbi:MAG: hypothetical protein JWM11_7426, partial [Planctomycetaceae bacterium]|nr:hypothetical protein [Planctomycetaceae bacterium]
FVNGQINANNMMRYARRLEFDSATIDINGTSVGFSSGDNTFGWRYYPRFQTPDIGSNTKVFFRDLLEGGPNRKQLLRERRLEPGMRECEAVVIMPSFVPYAELDVTSSWFKLINPKKKELDSKYTMRLSRQVKSAQNFASCVTDSQFYRDGDVLRLHHKIKQLESRLPMQSTMVQVPYENTLGGFGMFNTGVTDLAPELNGWYGAPAINPAADTTVFLVGNHFSVLSTKVIAGGLPLTTTELLSRQVMQVTIPAKSLQIGDERQKFVDVHLATPYGVTQHLLIPVASPASTGQTAGGGGGDGSDPPLSGPGWKTPKVSLAFVYGGLGIIAPPTGTPAVKPTPLLIVPGNDIKPETYDTVDVTLTFDKKIIPDPIVLKAVKYNADKKAYLLDGVVLSPAILSAAATVFGPEAFPPSTIAAKTTLKFKSTQSLGPDLDTKSGNDLTVNWIDASHLTKQP